MLCVNNSYNNIDNVSTPTFGSLCTNALTSLEGQSACTVAHSLLGEHVRIMQETFLGFLCKPCASGNKVSLYL